MMHNYRSRNARTNQRTRQAEAQLLEAHRQLQAQHERAMHTLQEYEKRNHQLEQTVAELQAQIAELQQALNAAQKMPAAEQSDEPIQATEGTADETDWQARYMRLQADMENFKKRLTQSADNDVQRARQQILRDMLPLADHLELAIQHLQSDNGTEPSSSQRQAYRENLQATLNSFLEVLKRHGVTRIPAEHQPFDPHHHEAMGRIASASIPADHVVQVVQAGYLEDGQLLRPARVLVSSGPETEDAGF